MTAGTVVITGGILATVILLCIIAVLCYCRLQVPPGALREARGGLGPRQRGRGAPAWVPPARVHPSQGFPTRPPRRVRPRRLREGKGLGRRRTQLPSGRAAGVSVWAPLLAPWALPSLPTPDGPPSAPQPREQAQAAQHRAHLQAAWPSCASVSPPAQLAVGIGGASGRMRACVRAHARAGGPRVTSPLPAVLLLQGRVGGGRGGA